MPLDHAEAFYSSSGCPDRIVADSIFHVIVYWSAATYREEMAVQAFTAVIGRDVRRDAHINPFTVTVTSGIHLDYRNGVDALGNTLRGVILRAGSNRRTVTLAPNTPPEIDGNVVATASWRRGHERNEVVLAAKKSRYSRAVLARVTLPGEVGLEVCSQPGGLMGASAATRVIAWIQSDDRRAFDLLVVLNTLITPWTADLSEGPGKTVWRVHIGQNRTGMQMPNLVGRLIAA